MKGNFVTLGIAVAVFAGALAAYGAWYAVVAHESAQDSSLATQITNRGTLAISAAASERTLAMIVPQEGALESHFIATPDIVSFLEDMQATGAALGSTVTVGSVSQDTSTRPHLTIAVTIEGSFSAVMRTLGVIENGPYDIETMQGSLTSASNGSSSDWTASLTVSVGTRASDATGTPPTFLGGATPAASPAPAKSAGASNAAGTSGSPSVSSPSDTPASESLSGPKPAV